MVHHFRAGGEEGRIWKNRKSNDDAYRRLVVGTWVPLRLFHVTRVHIHENENVDDRQSTQRVSVTPFAGPPPPW